jgi:photosystem II stability/assembly factor-like uncharacterized protein
LGVLAAQALSCSSDPSAPTQPPAPSGPRGWYWQNPLPVGNSLYDVWFDGTSRGYAVGNPGVILRTTDGGATWLEQRAVNPAAGQRFVADKNTGTGSRSERHHMATVDGGAWVEQTSGTTASLNDVEVDASVATAVGVGDDPDHRRWGELGGTGERRDR